MKMAYADPPYIGQAKRRYDCGEIDHNKLIQLLELEFADGWALSCSSVSLREILPLCPSRARVMAWVKPFASFKPNVNPAYAWEPVIVAGGRKRGRDIATVRDFVSCNITLQKGLCGAKPPDFSRWLFSVLHILPTDQFYDLFPGSGAVSAVWESYSGKKSLRFYGKRLNRLVANTNNELSPASVS